MNLLLDTHTVLWFWWNDAHLSADARDAVIASSNRKFVSPATAWEVAIKVSLGKLDIGGPFLGFFPEQMAKSGMEWLFIEDRHLSALTTLPFHHRDPFDRMIASQTISDEMTLVSRDMAFDRYGIQRVW